MSVYTVSNLTTKSFSILFAKCCKAWFLSTSSFNCIFCQVIQISSQCKVRVSFTMDSKFDHIHRRFCIRRFLSSYTYSNSNIVLGAWQIQLPKLTSPVSSTKTYCMMQVRASNGECSLMIKCTSSTAFLSPRVTSLIWRV